MKTSRRGFLGGLSSLAAFAPLGGFPAIVSGRNLNGKLAHACVGCGNMALADLKGLRTHARTQIVALCDVDSNYLKAAAKLCPGARLYRNALEMFEKEGDRIDSVNVSTPDHTHAMYVLDALGRGLNVYGQKPLCHDLADCRAIEALTEEKGAVTQMGTQIAAHACDRQTVAYLRSGCIGEVRHIWLFSNGGWHSKMPHRWPLPEAPVPATLDWKLWLGKSAYRPFAKGVYHPVKWRIWNEFGTSWLGDLGLHLLSPLWIGMDLGKAGPTDVTAEVPAEEARLRALYCPRMSHVTWQMPGCKASGGRPYPIEWCDGNIVDAKVRAETDPKFLPPPFIAELFAKTPIGKQPVQGRVVEGTEGWLLSVHYDKAPAVILKNGGTPPPLPDVGKAPSHWHEYLNACLGDGRTTSPFTWAGRMSEMVLLGTAAMAKAGHD